MDGEVLIEAMTAAGRGIATEGARATEGVPVTLRVSVRAPAIGMGAHVMIVIGVREIGAIKGAPETIGISLGGAPHAAGRAIAVIKVATATEIVIEHTRLGVTQVPAPVAMAVLTIANGEMTPMTTAAICTMTATVTFQS